MQKYAKEEKTVQCTVCKSSEQIHSKTHPASWNTFGIFQQQWPLSQNVSWIFKMEDPVNQNTPSIVHMSNPDTDSWQRGTHTHTSHLFCHGPGQASSSAVAAVEENRGIGVALTKKQRWLYDTNPKNTVLWANLSKWPLDHTFVLLDSMLIPPI